MPSTSTSSVWSAPWLITLLYTVIRNSGVASASRLITTEAMPSSHSTGRSRAMMVSRQAG